MKQYLFFILITTTLFSENAVDSISKTTNDNLFITDFEYGQMLYKNPRGIGCIKCHGKDGEELFIARYIHKKKEKIISTQSIHNLSLQSFRKKLTSKPNTKSIMPTYFLTEKEIKSIHNYITNKKYQ